MRHSPHQRYVAIGAAAARPRCAERHPRGAPSPARLRSRRTTSSRTGQAWGRKALGIRLVGQATGQPIGAGAAFVRDLAHVVDSIICGIGYLFPLWDAQRQTLADKVCKTVVVR